MLRAILPDPDPAAALENLPGLIGWGQMPGGQWRELCRAEDGHDFTDPVANGRFLERVHSEGRRAGALKMRIGAEGLDPTTFSPGTDILPAMAG